MALKVIESIIGIFDDVTGRLAAISPAGTSDVSYIPTSDTPLSGAPVMAQTDPLTGGLEEFAHGDYLGMQKTAVVDTVGTVLADNFSDNYSALNRAIDRAVALKNNYQSVAGWVDVLLPPGRILSSPITVPQGVRLVGRRSHLIAIANGYLLTLTGNGSVSNMMLSGQYNTNGMQAGGVHAASTSNGATLYNVSMDGFYDKGVYDEGYANHFDKVTAINVLYAQADTLADYSGGIDLSGADGWVRECEVSTRGALGMSASGKAVGLRVNGANYMVNDVIAETSDIGVLVSANATQLKMDGVRGELSKGHGWLVLGGNGRISNPSALRNSKQTAGAFDGWHCDGAAQFNVTNLWVYGNDSGPENWGLYDGNYSASQYVTYIAPYIINTNNSIFTQNVSGTKIMLSDGPVVGISGATPNIRMNKIFAAGNASPVTITSFAQSFNGQRILVKGDGYMTVPHNGTSFVMLSGANTLLANGVWYEFLKSGGNWYQLR